MPAPDAKHLAWFRAEIAARCATHRWFIRLEQALQRFIRRKARAAAVRQDCAPADPELALAAGSAVNPNRRDARWPQSAPSFSFGSTPRTALIGQAHRGTRSSTPPSSPASVATPTSSISRSSRNGAPVLKAGVPNESVANPPSVAYAPWATWRELPE
jgi:hypothetical protein